MKLLLTFDYYADIIDVPEWIINKKHIIKNSFYDWLYDKNNHHQYWVSKTLEHDGSQDLVMFGSDAFLEWLNEKVLDKEEKATIVIEGLDEWDNNLPSLWF